MTNGAAPREGRSPGWAPGSNLFLPARRPPHIGLPSVRAPPGRGRGGRPAAASLIMPYWRQGQPPKAVALHCLCFFLTTYENVILFFSRHFFFLFFFFFFLFGFHPQCRTCAGQAPHCGNKTEYFSSSLMLPGVRLLLGSFGGESPPDPLGQRLQMVEPGCKRWPGSVATFFFFFFFGVAFARYFLKLPCEGAVLLATLPRSCRYFVVAHGALRRSKMSPRRPH